MSSSPSMPPKTYHISPTLAQRIKDELDENVYLCYQCVKCTSGCPLAEFFDWQPNQVMRALQLGQEDIALQSQTPWLCASCQTCTTRCPQGLDIAAIMEFLTREALERGYKPSVPEVNVFNQAFLREVHLWGRSYELGLMAEIKLRNRDLFSDMDLAAKMFQKNKMPFFPKFVRPPHQAKAVPGASEAVAYYPGCSLHSTAREYDLSSRLVCELLDMKLVEPHGWVCCGSSAAHRADPQEATRLPMENLALIEQSGFKEVTMPCAACFSRHKAALHEIRQDEDRRRMANEKTGYDYQDTVQVSSLPQAILNHVGAEKLAEKVQKPLSGLKVVCYYGCLLTRPPEVTEAEHPENPTEIDQIMAALGAEVLDWSYKTTCCGAAHSLTRPDIVLKLSRHLIEEARRAGADAIAIACPLCHTNLDARQIQMDLEEAMPVFYFTQLMAVALGATGHSAGLHKNLIDPLPLLRDRGILSAV